MDITEKLAEVKRMLEPATEDDSVLLSYLDQAKSIILNRLFPYMSDEEAEETELPKRFDWKQVRICVYLLNKRGAEGEVQHQENGINRRYRNSDVPEDMLSDVFPFVGLPR